MISTLAWVPRGVAKENPDKYQLSEDEYQRICELTQQQLIIAKSDLDIVTENQKELKEKVIKQQEEEKMKDIEDDLAEYHMDDYEEEGAEVPEIFSAMGTEPLSVFEDNSQDPYITIKEEEDEDEKEEMKIERTDSLILTGKTEDEISHLEVYLFDSVSYSLYVHHDIMLPSFPLCIEPINCTMQDSRNWCAIGSFDPTIEIWNLDVVDAMYPYLILGQKESLTITAEATAKKSKKKKIKSKSLAKTIGHSDAVLSISWNSNAQNFLLSASADTSIILWDIKPVSKEDKGGKQIRKFFHHSDKVSCVKWHPFKPSVFVSAGYDKRVYLIDAQLPEPVVAFIELESDIECLSWDIHAMNMDNYGGLAVGTDSGIVHYLHINDGQFQIIMTIAANSSSLTSVDIHPHIPGFLMITAAESSSQLQVWDMYDNELLQATGAIKYKAQMLASKETGAGKVFAGSICADDAYLIAVGGSLGLLSIWNVTDSKSIVQTFHGRKGRSGFVNMLGENAINPDDPETTKIPREIEDEEENQDDDEMEDDEAEMEEVLEEMKGVRSSK